MKKALKILFKVVVFFIGWALIAGLTPVPNFKSDVWWRFYAELIPFLILIIFTIIFWIIEKRKIKLSVRKTPIIKIFSGIIIGIIWTVIPFLFLYIMNLLEISTINNIDKSILWIISIFLNVCMQELLIRGYIFQIIKKNYNVIIATLITIAIFTLLHGGAFEAGVIPVLNVISMSIFMTVLLEYSESILTIIGSHFVWNFIGGFLTNAISLAEDYPSLINLSINGNSFLSGGSYKLEGSIFTLIANIVLILVFLTLLIRKNKNSSEI